MYAIHEDIIIDTMEDVSPQKARDVNKWIKKN